MSDEQPIALKKRKTTPTSSTVLTCIIHFTRNTKETDVKPLTSHSFQVIRQAAGVRQSVDNSSQRLDSICANLPSELDASKHGFHRWCYSSFTNVAKIIKSETTLSTAESLDRSSVSEEQIRKSSRSLTASCSSSVLFPQNECIFCSKGRKKAKSGEEPLAKCVSRNAEANIKQCAADKSDYAFLGKIVDVDLIAKEARYHESCRKAYIRTEDRTHHRPSTSSEQNNIVTGGREQRAAYDAAFQYICQYVTDNIIHAGSVERMTMLRERYLNYIVEHSPQFYNAQHKTDKLKEKLVAYFGNKIQFWRPNKRSDLVYSSDVNTGEAVNVAFEAATSESKILQEAASILRRNIQQAFKSSEELPWPPSDEYLKSHGPSPPSCLTEFLTLLISGKNSSSASTKTIRLSNSFAQDVCSAATQCKWKMPKHILLASTLRSLGARAVASTFFSSTSTSTSTWGASTSTSTSTSTGAAKCPKYEYKYKYLSHKYKYEYEYIQ
jgi:hypothetical protein